jgi:hypothetical protein
MPSCDIIMYHVRLWSPLSYPRRAALLSPPTRGSSHCVTLRPIASRSPLSPVLRGALGSLLSTLVEQPRRALGGGGDHHEARARGQGVCVCVCVCVGEDRVAGARVRRIVIG